VASRPATVPDDYLCERLDGVLTVTLNRPHRLNALNWGLRLGLEALWADTRGDDSIRCVVVTGSGSGFCSGADTEDLAGPRVARGEDLDAELSFLPGRQLEVPVVVAVNGVCAGGGLHFVADADIAIAGQSATFLDPHVSVGQVSGIEPASLALRVPLQVLGRMALLGRNERLDADAAARVGLVSEVVADELLLGRAAEIAASIAAASPAAVRATRRVLRDLEVSVVEPAMRAGWAAVQAHWAHPDAVEGPVAFAERRAPRWSTPSKPAEPVEAGQPQQPVEGKDGPDRR
jgi:enoyl-CoA hydratase/carnithine racemase